MNESKAATIGVMILLSVWPAAGCGGKQETPPPEMSQSESPPQEVQGGLGMRGEPKKGALMGNEIKGGSLPKEEIRKTVHANIQQVIDCYEAALAGDPTLSGKVSIKFIIALDGTVTMAAVANTEINHPDCEACIAEAVKSWRFPKPSGGIVIVTYPFDLSPKKE